MRQCYLFACHTSITARKFITEFNNPEKVAITRLRTTQKVAKVQKNHPEKVTGFKRGRKKENNLTKEDWKERYEILKKYQAFLKAQRERK